MSDSIQVMCPGCGREAEFPSKAAGRTARCPCGEKISVPKAPPADPTNYVLEGTTPRLPQVCACCLEPATHPLIVSKTEIEDVGIAKIRRTASVEILFCGPCSDQTVWARTGMSGVLVGALVVGFLVAGALLLGALFAFGGRLYRYRSTRTRDVACTLAALAAGVGAGYATGRRLAKRRPTSTVPASHSCRFDAAVRIVNFSESYTQLSFGNPKYGILFAQLNE